jgi:hypothetical protein
VVLSIRDRTDLRQALCDEPPQAGQEDTAGLPLVLEDEAGGEAWQDHPLSFDPMSRRYAARPVRYDAVPAGGPDETHDPFTLLTR